MGVAEQMNLRFFQGVYKCYFHAHYTNIEGWYDPSVISRESIIETFKELCNTILAHTALAHINQTKAKQNNNNKHNKHNGGGARKYKSKRNNNQNKKKKQPPPNNNNKRQNVITLTAPNGLQQQPIFNMLQPNPLGLTPNGMNPINQINAINQMNKMSQLNLQQQPQHNMNMDGQDKNNQLLAATQSMLNGISAIPQIPLN